MQEAMLTVGNGPRGISEWQLVHEDEEKPERVHGTVQEEAGNPSGIQRKMGLAIVGEHTEKDPTQPIGTPASTFCEEQDKVRGRSGMPEPTRVRFGKGLRTGQLRALPPVEYRRSPE
jgi:hypothetical protein